jgi:uncharacterized protein
MSLDALVEAIQNGDEAAARQLVQADPGLAGARLQGGPSALLLAVYYGQTRIVELLADRLKADNLRGLDIFEAAALGDLTRAAELLEDQPDLVNAVSVDGFQPLGLACFFGHTETALYLVDQGAGVNTPSANAQKVTPLHSAAASGQIGIVRRLLERGADVNARQEGGFTALHAAAQNGDVEMIRLLLAHDADRAALADGKTPLGYAMGSGSAEAVELLGRKENRE